MKKTLAVLLLIVILLGQIDLRPQVITPLGNTTNTRFGWLMPAYFDGLAAQFSTDCHDLYFFMGTGETYGNTLGIAFYRDGELLKTQTVVFQPWGDLFLSTPFEYDTVVFANTDNHPDSVRSIFCWMTY